jgi:TFIIF-interacting CTD phosphatase-like protein
MPVSPAWTGASSARQVLNGTARTARSPHTEGVSNEKQPESLSNVKPGDVLVSHATAVREHEISVIPNPPHATSLTHDAAVRDGRSEADAMGVDAWLTEDHTHVVKIAANRPPDE